MAIERFIRQDRIKRDETPRINIRKQHLGFNAAFVKAANLTDFSKVGLSVDPESYRIYFRFHSDKNESNSLALFSDNKSGNTKACSLVGLKKIYPFISKISSLENYQDKQFCVERDSHDKEGWVAVLNPSFENKISSESEIKDANGIYRYLRSAGEIVYIGKGKILSRLNSPDRDNWDFDVVEYSLIQDPLEQGRWESYWLDKFVDENGKLPFYNKQKGKKHD